jgi:hypothetical protein
VGELTTATGIVALGAALLALLALVISVVLGRRLRRLRESQQVLLGEGGERDLITHASDLDTRLAGLAGEVQQAVGRLETRDAGLQGALEGAVSHVAVVRYDAMGEMAGRQSSSVALLDSHGCGVVLSSILHRDQARLYAKGIVDGVPEMALSPEEEEAIDAALRPKGHEGEERGPRE